MCQIMYFGHMLRTVQVAADRHYVSMFHIYDWKEHYFIFIFGFIYFLMSDPTLELWTSACNTFDFIASERIFTTDTIVHLSGILSKRIFKCRKYSSDNVFVSNKTNNTTITSFDTFMFTFNLSVSIFHKCENRRLFNLKLINK